jgi:hypothetical protein
VSDLMRCAMTREALLLRPFNDLDAPGATAQAVIEPAGCLDLFKRWCYRICNVTAMNIRVDRWPEGVDQRSR